MITGEDGNEVEKDLRAALRRREPDSDLTPRILARLAARQPQRRRPEASRKAPRWYVAAALAACLLLSVFLAVRGQRNRARRQAAVAAGQQLARALRLAAADLNAVRRQVDRNDQGIRAASRARIDD